MGRSANARSLDSSFDPALDHDVGPGIDEDALSSSGTCSRTSQEVPGYECLVAS